MQAYQWVTGGSSGGGGQCPDGLDGVQPSWWVSLSKAFCSRPLFLSIHSSKTERTLGKMGSTRPHPGRGEVKSYGW